MVTDMEQQVKANTFRIQVLQRENVSLMNSLTRLKHSHSHTNSVTPQNITVDSRTSDQDKMEPIQERQVTRAGTSYVLQQRTLELSAPDPEETYNRLKRAVRTGSAGTNRGRK